MLRSPIMLQVLILVLIALLLLLIAMLVYILFGLYITAQGPPFAPISQQRLDRILKLAGLKPGSVKKKGHAPKVADLGSGDGRVVMALAKAGVQADGYEINPRLVWQSRRAIKKAGLEDSATIHRASFWRADLSQYDLIVVYGINRIMENLADKLEDELKDGAKIISVYFELPDWQPDKVLADVRLYQA